MGQERHLDVGVAQPKAAPVSSSREEMSKEMGKGAVRREEDGGLGTAVSVGSVGWNVLGLDDPIVGVSDSDKEKNRKRDKTRVLGRLALREKEKEKGDQMYDDRHCDLCWTL